MKPVNSAPVMVQVQGFGVSVYGKRDVDAETGTFVKTWCVSLLFIPIIALRAYRVAPAEGGAFYFLGREPLSAFAKFWNILLIAAVLGVLGGVQYSIYTSVAAQR
jgi:hypothetical protein